MQRESVNKITSRDLRDLDPGFNRIYLIHGANNLPALAGKSLKRAGHA